ncbi:MAG TPA: aminomethyltransferase family protein, partial [Acidimicrobiales bacterium]|nr:aminomethyltransferase family protein [Acidimicrobiales bacterium]
GHLGPDHYFMSTTSSGSAAVLEWIQLWLQTGRTPWKVFVTSMLSAYASINVAGPRSRELLKRLVKGVDLAPESFPYMNVRTGQVAGVPDCHMWRIGFTGELSYELHVPSGFGLHVWEALLEAGSDLCIKPFGLEAQRVLRLEKGHFIVTQDTDASTLAYQAGLDWLVKLEKEEFIGKEELVREHQEGSRSRLVALQPVDAELVPPEASQIVDGSRSIGRITSSRYSPSVQRSICLGIVDTQFSETGTELTVRLPDGRNVTAHVMEQLAHFDPEGNRLRG